MPYVIINGRLVMTPPELREVWEYVKEKMRTEGALNKIYDPDLDGALGAVKVESLIVPDGEKIYFGTERRYSLRYDPERGGIVIRDEKCGRDIAVIKT